MGRRKNLIPAAEQKLTRREELYVKILVSEDGLVTQREAALRAGVPACSAHARAYEMMKRPRVARAIAEYREELDSMYAVDYKRSERDLKIIRDTALKAGAFGAATAAEVARGKLAGLYTSKSELRVGSIDSMERAEVLKELREYQERRKEYADGNGTGPIIDITPQEETEAAPEEYRSGTMEDPDHGAEDDGEEGGIDKAGELGNAGSS